MVLLLTACFDIDPGQDIDIEREPERTVDFQNVTHWRNGLELQATGGSGSPPDVPDNPFEGEEYASLYDGEEELCRLSWHAEATWDVIDENGPELQYNTACWEPVMRGDVALCKAFFGQPAQMVEWPLGVQRVNEQTARFSSHDGWDWVDVGEGVFDGQELSYFYDEDIW